MEHWSESKEVSHIRHVLNNSQTYKQEKKAHNFFYAKLIDYLTQKITSLLRLFIRIN